MIQWRMEWVCIRACHACRCIYYLVLCTWNSLNKISWFDVDCFNLIYRIMIMILRKLLCVCSQSLVINIFLFNSYNKTRFVYRTGTEWFAPTKWIQHFFMLVVLLIKWYTFNIKQSHFTSSSSGSHSNVMRKWIICVSFLTDSSSIPTTKWDLIRSHERNPTTTRTSDKNYVTKKYNFTASVYHSSFNCCDWLIPHTQFSQYHYHNSVDKVETVNIKPGYLVETIPSTWYKVIYASTWHALMHTHSILHCIICSHYYYNRN